jgi:hypothetical protein
MIIVDNIIYIAWASYKLPSPEPKYSYALVWHIIIVLLHLTHMPGRNSVMVHYTHEGGRWTHVASSSRLISCCLLSEWWVHVWWIVLEIKVCVLVRILMLSMVILTHLSLISWSLHVHHANVIVATHHLAVVHSWCVYSWPHKVSWLHE